MADNLLDCVTLGDGTLNVEGEFGFIEKVTGSRIIRRSPHALSPDAEDRMYQNRSTIIHEGRVGEKWCQGVLGKECGWRALENFADDPTRPDKKNRICKECKNALDRYRYAAEKEMLGAQVRIYRRREAS